MTLQLTQRQEEFALSQHGKDLLREAFCYSKGSCPVGNANLGLIFTAIRYGWINSDGITRTGKKVYHKYCLGTTND